jgi:hypothetical protein
MWGGLGYDRVMKDTLLNVEIQTTKDGSPWSTVATGTWRPGHSDPLELDGDPGIPQAAIDNLLSCDPTGHESGSCQTQVGKDYFRMNFRRGSGPTQLEGRAQ